MEQINIAWPSTSKGSSPAAVIYAKDFVATREEKSGNFVVVSPKSKAQTVFMHSSPILAWKRFESTIVVLHSDWSLQILNALENTIASYTKEILFATQDDSIVSFLKDDDLDANGFLQVLALNRDYFAALTRRGVFYWKRSGLVDLVEGSIKFIESKGSDNSERLAGMIKVLEDSCINEQNELFVATSTTFHIIDLNTGKKKSLFDWTESLGQFFKMSKYDKIVVGTKSNSIVIWNLEASKRTEIDVEKVVTAIFLDQSFLITGDGEGGLQLRNPVTGDIIHGIQSKKNETEDTESDDLDEKTVLGGVASELKLSQKSKGLKIDVKERVNQITRNGRYVIAAHEDGYITIWDVIKSSKTPLTSFKTNGPIRSLTLDAGSIAFGSVLNPDNSPRTPKTLSLQRSSTTSFGERVKTPLNSMVSKSEGSLDIKSNSMDSLNANSRATTLSMNDESETESKKTPSKTRSRRNSEKSSKKDEKSEKKKDDKKEENGNGYFIEHYIWTPKLPFFSEFKPVKEGTLPVPIADLDSKSLQERLDFFSSPIDWWEYESQKNPFTVLIFYRGLWDTIFDVRYLQRWEKVMPLIKMLGGTVIAVTCDTPENAAKAKKEWDLSFDTISERSNQLAKFFNLIISKGRRSEDSNCPEGMNESGVFIVTNERKYLFKWTMIPHLVANFNGGRERPDPFDVWNYIGHKISSPDKSAPIKCKICIGCPLTHFGWDSWSSKDLRALPGGNQLGSDDEKNEKNEKAVDGEN